MFHNKLTIFVLLLASCTFFCANGQINFNLSKAEFPPSSEKSVAALPDQDVEKKKTTTTAVPLPPDTTPTSTTTTTTTTSTTTTTTTTTPAPTQAPTTSTTTPTPTTPEPITTTPAPGPYPEPSIGTWNSSCIMIKMAAQLNFTYETKENKTATALYNLPVDAKVQDALCDFNTTETIQINWGPDDYQHILTMQFDKKNESVILTMMKFFLPLMSDRFPNAKENQTIQLIHRGFDFSAPLKMSYHCTRPQKFNLTETVIDKEIVGHVTVHDVQVEAFRAAGATGFSSAKDCDSSETSDVVPIAVGIALVALIMIVLISYLCARRRSTSRGYRSF